MSLPTWTPAELSSEAASRQCKAWRMVEAQHNVSTMKLVDSLAEQELLEDIIEHGKPPLPPATEGLHYLLATPFRYETLPPAGSRFRAVHDPGVFYGAERIQTAAAETGYRRWRFLQDSAGLDRLPPSSFTAFSVQITGKTVDLRISPFDRDQSLWTHPSDYLATQAFARTARLASVDAIMYQSVRDPDTHWCIAVLTASAFAERKPEDAMQTWTLTLLPEEAVWQRQGSEAFAFETRLWSVDGRR